MKTNNISLKAAFFVLLAASCMIGCTEEAEPQAADNQDQNEHFISITPEQEELSGITYGVVPEEEVEQTLSCSGVIDVPPGNRVSMTTVYGGYITYTGVYPGDQIKKGQLLARLQDPMYIDLQRSYLEGLSKLEYLEADYKRKDDLQKTQSVSEKQFQESKRDLQSIRVEVDALKAQLTMAGFSIASIKKNGVQQELEIKSPINGFVTAVKVNQGVHLEEGEVLFELIDPSHVHIELNVYPNDLDKLAVGQLVYYRIAGAEIVKKGEIKLINKAVTAENRSILVHVHPDEEDEEGLLPGTFVQAQIVVSAQRAKVLPLQAVNRVDDAYVAYKQVPNGVEAVYFAPRFTTEKYVHAAVLGSGKFVLSGAEKLIMMEDEAGHGH